MHFRKLGFALALTLAVAAPVVAEDVAAPPVAEAPATYQNLLTPLFKGAETVIGQKIAYPAGDPNVTAAIVVIAPGKESGWHSHEVPLFVTVLEGDISVDYGSKGVKVYKPGDSFLEAEEWPHNATNKTEKIVRLLAVYMGTEGKANASPATGPQ
jgi:quercetin dioxygenase-like cupin family protein